MNFEIRPFAESMTAEAGVLLAGQQARHRQVLPGLPVSFTEPETAAKVVAALLQREWASGVAAFGQGKMLGYLVGEMVMDTLWGRSAWVRFGGSALAPAADPDIVRDLYAALAEHWMAFGCYTHFAVVLPSEQAVVGQWFALCFGLEQIYGLADLTTRDLSPLPEPTDTVIRRAGPEDRAALEALSDVIWRHQVKAPVWGIHLPERQARHRREYGELAADPEARVWLAFHQGQPVGVQCAFAVEREDDNPFLPLLPESCAELAVAGVREEVRGTGIGRVLTQRLLAEAVSEGYRHCLTDWRSTNLLSSRFWPRQGFVPAAYRLVRRIDPRIFWAGECP